MGKDTPFVNKLRRGRGGGGEEGRVLLRIRFRSSGGVGGLGIGGLRGKGCGREGPSVCLSVCLSGQFVESRRISECFFLFFFRFLFFLVYVCVCTCVHLVYTSPCTSDNIIYLVFRELRTGV